ncbi:MAG: rRNA maturation RNase YbeY [Sphingobacteriales bacterium]|nr:MAG: rRNA maturation RNase YbeY [Sphingobacteriales bacterium]
MAIRYFEEEGVRSKLKQKRALSKFISDEIILKHLEVQQIDINYIFCNDESLLEKNIAFLDHNTLTDIITFDLSATADDLMAELYISVDRVADNAAAFGVRYEQELHRVIFHGILHLCGFKDKTDKDAKEMRHQEDLCIRAYFKQ